MQLGKIFQAMTKKKAAPPAASPRGSVYVRGFSGAKPVNRKRKLGWSL